jgi:hypothetical protein
MNTNHWTTELAIENYKKGYKYTILPRSGAIQNNFAFNNLHDFHQFLPVLYANKQFDKVRISLKPEIDRYIIMEYPEDGSYWVVGWIINGEICSNNLTL